MAHLKFKKGVEYYRDKSGSAFYMMVYRKMLAVHRHCGSWKLILSRCGETRRKVSKTCKVINGDEFQAVYLKAIEDINLTAESKIEVGIHKDKLYSIS